MNTLQDFQYVYVGNKPSFQVTLNHSIYNINKGERFYFPVNHKIDKFKDVIKYNENSKSIIDARANFNISTFMFIMPNTIRECILSIPAIKTWKELHADSKIILQINSKLRSCISGIDPKIEIVDKYDKFATKTFDLRNIKINAVEQHTTPAIMMYLKALNLPPITGFGKPSIKIKEQIPEYDILFDTGCIIQNYNFGDENLIKEILNKYKHKYKIAITGEYIFDGFEYINKDNLLNVLNKTKLLVTFGDLDIAYYRGATQKPVLMLIPTSRTSFNCTRPVFAIEKSLMYMPIDILLNPNKEEIYKFIDGCSGFTNIKIENKDDENIVIKDKINKKFNHNYKNPKNYNNKDIDKNNYE